MTDMRKTPGEKAEDMSPLMETADYPYGLCISLTHEDLEKMDLDDECEVGDLIHIKAMAKVTSVSKREVNGETDCRVELQIIMLGCEDEDDEDDDED